MKICKKYFWIIMFLWLGLSGLEAQKFVRVNQIGYEASLPKIATVAGVEGSFFELKKVKTNEVVYRGELEPSKYWIQSKEDIQKIDFSDFNTPGTYYLQVRDEKSYPFEIKENGLFDELSQAVVRSFYYWRSSCAMEAPYSTFRGIDFSRPMGHPDTVVYIHSTAASESRRVGSVISSPKGWYDAGDYNKYVVNAGISLHQLLMAYELFPDYYKNLKLNIPEGDTSNLPDYYHELKWEADWLLTMQDPNDGGVYHKLTTLRFSGFVMPDKDEADRYVVEKSTAAALDFAAQMAKFSYVFKNIDSAYSQKALNAAVRAWKWAKKNPAIFFYNPEDVRTGSYSDDNVTDEFFWAASELLIATGEKQYYDELDFFQHFDIPQWRYVSSLGLLSLRVHLDQMPSFVDRELIQKKFHSLAQATYNQFKFSVGRLSLKKFEWGSNGDIAMNGNIMGLAYLMEKNEAYLDGLMGNFDYLMGANPTDYCFVSGFGSKYPKHFHDRRMTSDNIDEPLPGYICGGANPNQVSDCGKGNYPSSAPARCYLDETCSYSTNEIAVNWNAPLVLLVGMVENVRR